MNAACDERLFHLRGFVSCLTGHLLIPFPHQTEEVSIRQASAVFATCPFGECAEHPPIIPAALTLPSDWQGDSSGGVSAKAGTWAGTVTGAGTAAHYRLKSSGGTCHEQGTVTITGGGGDLTMNNPVLEIGQPVTMNTWGRTAPGA